MRKTLGLIPCVLVVEVAKQTDLKTQETTLNHIHGRGHLLRTCIRAGGGEAVEYRGEALGSTCSI